MCLCDNCSSLTGQSKCWWTWITSRSEFSVRVYDAAAKPMTTIQTKHNFAEYGFQLQGSKPPAWAQGGDSFCCLVCLRLPLPTHRPDRTQKNTKSKLNMALRRLAGQMGLSTQVQVAFSRAFASGACAGLPGA